MTGRQFGLPPATFFGSGETKAFMMIILCFESNLAPPSGWFALNTDGAAKISDNRAGCGGLWEVQITHVFRESKRCADMLANMGSERAIGIEFFANPPPTPRVMQIVDGDFRGVTFPRLISV
ncbi:hypothetical protein TSUD_299790 [Trifolium subterraneum]|uniref:RNase H type-1 domain-containing protein n=1 Tax=Trifolium subterraneum TaxID=3900 RepID=A0A2Z6NIR1_TRISU|nr:hypothetical protein TSUD_299790 [Trifolium subterraneum]